MPQPPLLPLPDDLCDTCAYPRRDHPVTHRGGFVCAFRDRSDGRPWRRHEVRGGAAVRRRHPDVPTPSDLEA